MSRERVRQLEKRLQEKLKRFLHEELGESVLETCRQRTVRRLLLGAAGRGR